MILHTFGLASDFFNSHKWKNKLLQEMILCIHGPTIGFFNTHDEKKIIYMCGSTNGLFYSHMWTKKMILHSCKPTSGFWDSHKRKKFDIAHLRTHKWFFKFTYVEKKMMLHIAYVRTHKWLLGLTQKK
jgi:hypothetical protein